MPSRRLLILLLLVLTLGWLDNASADSVVTWLKANAEVDATTASAVQRHSNNQQSQRDGLCDANAREHQPSAALLSDAHDIYRICNSRPGRVMPTYGSKPGRSLGKQSISRKSNPLKFLLSRFNQRLETAPFATVASCDYYVIALRHIVR